MTQAPTTADRPSPPDPAPDRSAGHAPPPAGIARLLALLHMVIGYGQTLAASLQLHTPGTDIIWIGVRFHTSDLATIVARVRRGLLIAAAFQERLLQRAATGRDVQPVLPRDAMPRPRTARALARPRAARHQNLVDLPFDRLPTAAQIAAELRRRPIGAILVDVCRDLGILPGDLPPAWQQELSDLVVRYGGSLYVLVFREWENEVRPLVAAAARQEAACRRVRRPARRVPGPASAPRAAKPPPVSRDPAPARSTGPP